MYLYRSTHKKPDPSSYKRKKKKKIVLLRFLCEKMTFLPYFFFTWFCSLSSNPPPSKYDVCSFIYFWVLARMRWKKSYKPNVHFLLSFSARFPPPPLFQAIPRPTSPIRNREVRKLPSPLRASTGCNIDSSSKHAFSRRGSSSTGVRMRTPTSRGGGKTVQIR